MHAEEKLTEPVLSTEPSDPKEPGKLPLESSVFQAIVCLEGRYIAQEDNPTRGVVTTPDGMEFPTFLGKTKLREKLIQNYGSIEPGQPFPKQPLVWTAYPKLLNNSLTLTIIGVRADSYLLEPEHLKAQGVLIHKSENRFRLRVYRNLGKVPAAKLTEFSDLDFKGHLPQKSKLGWMYRVLAHREGLDFVVDTIEPIHICYGRQVKGAIAHILNPPQPPVKRILGQKVKSDEGLVESTAIEPSPPTDIAEAAQSSADRPAPETPFLEVAENITPSKTVADPRVEKVQPKHKLAASQVNVPVELEPVKSPQPEPVAIETTVPIQSPAVPAAKSKKKKAATPTSAAKVPAEKTPEAAALPKPKFLVQVDRQTFGGQSSVMLKTGMLFIDGKQVVRTKLAIVVGEAQTVSADGKTQKSGNRTILSSR
jgi:hypothetical protein